MARTYKDQPYRIRQAKSNHKIVDKDWRKFASYRYHPLDIEGLKIPFDEWNQMVTDYFGDYTHEYRWYNWPVPSWFRRGLTRAYRAKTNQMVREGKYDDIPRPRKDAGWLYW